MSLKSQSISFVSCLSLILATPFVPMNAKAATCDIKKMEDECKAQGDAAGEGLMSSLKKIAEDNPNNMNRQLELSGGAADVCSKGYLAAAESCEKEKRKECDKCYPTDGTLAECNKRNAAAAAALKEKAGTCAATAKNFFNNAGTTVAGGGENTPGGGETPPGDSGPGGGQQGGGSDSLMPLLMGAGLGALAGYMMGKDDKDDKKEDKPGEPEEEETPRTPADCSVEGAESNSDCNADFEAKCTADPTAAGCGTFMASYCDSGAAAVVADDKETPTDEVKPASNKGQGVGSAFCNVVAFCAGGTNDNCLTCIEAKRPKPDSCKADPSTCISQYSQKEIDDAKVACPVDPKFSDPKFAAGGDAGNPSVILPNSIGRGPASDIEGQYGKSVFSISSTAFKKMCFEGRLNNCPVQ